MSLWDALAPAATVAQLVGADAAGLISATLQAVRTARRNRKECRSLARRVMMVGDLLQLVGSSETMRRPEVRRALDGLGDALRRAFELVESCQERGAAYGFVMAARQAEQFRDVQSEIDSYLLVFPMVSHIDVTIRLDRIYNMLLPPDHAQQGLEAVPGSPTSHVEPYARNERSDLGFLQSENSLAETSEAKEHQTTAHHETLEARLNGDKRLTGDKRLKWLCWLPQQNVEGYDLLKAATNNFSSRNIIASVGWSTVYKANIGGFEVAIKRIPNDSLFDNEHEILKKLQHKNIIKLLGHSTGKGEGLLVYEYMPNGSLDKFIFDASRGASIDWMSRFHIMEGIAQGLHYLHMREECIVHKDLKPSNILLDSDMNAKIGDFGIATVLCSEFQKDAHLSGTWRYMPSEYMSTGILSRKVDVYSYGVTFLGVISGKSEYSLTEEAWDLWATMSSSELIDPLLRNGDQIADITRCIQIAMLCIQRDPADRPSMSDVLLMLSNEMIIPSPKVPWSYPADGPPSPPEGILSDGATWSSSDITWPR